MASLLLPFLGWAVALYVGFCWGANWSRSRVDRVAQSDHERALETRRVLLRQLEALGGQQPFRDAAHAAEQARLVDAIKQADREVDRALAVVNATFHETTNWSPLMPFVEWLPWGDRVRAVRDWWRGHWALVRARKAWRREVDEPLSDADQRMLEEVKRRALGHTSNSD